VWFSGILTKGRDSDEMAKLEVWWQILLYPLDPGKVTCTWFPTILLMRKVRLRSFCIPGGQQVEAWTGTQASL
jgi:hypothetical protein